MTTRCGQCGDCCRRFYLNATKQRLREDLARYAERRARGEEVDEALVADARFILEHWHGGRRSKDGTTKDWTCDQFDPETNLCLAHEDRPPVCRGFPWYGEGPRVAKLANLPRCSFWRDIPRRDWPAGTQPVTLRRGARAADR